MERGKMGRGAFEAPVRGGGGPVLAQKEFKPVK